MTTDTIRYTSHLQRGALLVALMVVTISGSIFADNEGRPSYPEVAYLHGSVGVGIAVLNSSDIQNYIDNKIDVSSDITNVGVEFPFSLRFGIRNFAQFEYRLERGVGHSVYYEADRIALTQDDFNVDSDEWLAKVNPFFALYDDPSVSTFLVFGKGNADYLDPLGEGFSDGDKTILGAEITKMFRYYGFSVSAERHTLSFDQAVVDGDLDRSRSWDASWWMVQGSISIGVSY